ncbi:hypothetical protein FACS189450_04080 [Spirochaetia bacterium]|nr:hypothetical protein FACS189450_04080 [Spirochaetia bacterium]
MQTGFVEVYGNESPLFNLGGKSLYRTDYPAANPCRAEYAASYLYDAGLFVMRKGKNAAKIKIVGKDNKIAFLGVGYNRRIRGIRMSAR